MMRWEYRFIEVDTKVSEKHFNDLGAEGWELSGFAMVNSNLNNKARQAIFKRPLAEKRI